MGMILQALIDGILIGGVYATMAVGLSLAFGVMRIINWAQGELLMVSMYISYFVFNGMGINPYLGVQDQRGVGPDHPLAQREFLEYAVLR